MVEGYDKFCFCPLTVSEQILASYEYENKPTNKGAPLVPIGIPTECRTTCSPKT
jgi:hypothetical protein